MKIKFFGALAISLLVGLSACKKEQETPQVPNEEEVITTLTYTLTPTAGGTPVVLSFKDLDGDGGDDPVIVNGDLKENTEYSGVIQLLNEQESPAEDITLEVEEEGDEHQFFFPNDIAGLQVNYMDQDKNNRPIGIKTHVVTGAQGSGTLTVVLRHQPDKTAPGVSDGEIANAGGETDIQVTFNVNVQ
ncbi:type 1 periplasmic binding fold superfamily protein [bacterium SCSIO 12643]|nr:type 1 periplasmic binding fold superfamily protein [bacterium SCSIO 12643]